MVGVRFLLLVVREVVSSSLSEASGLASPALSAFPAFAKASIELPDW